MGAALLGVPLLSATGAGSAIGLLGAGGVFAPAAGSLFASVGLGTLLSAAGTATSIFGAIRGAQGARQQGAANAQAARYNAAVAANNATIAGQNKQWASENAERESASALMKTRAEVGAIKANQAASGVDIGSDSAIDVRSSAKETGQLSAIDIRTKAARQAYGYDVEAQDFENQRNLYDAQAGNDVEAGNINSGTTLLSGLSTAASSYSNYLDKRSLN